MPNTPNGTAKSDARAVRDTQVHPSALESCEQIFPPADPGAGSARCATRALERERQTRRRRAPRLGVGSGLSADHALPRAGAVRPGELPVQLAGHELYKLVRAFIAPPREPGGQRPYPRAHRAPLAGHDQPAPPASTPSNNLGTAFRHAVVGRAAQACEAPML